ncbi:MAG: hypothetical protein JO353_06985, partial [Phycisphaerae bacterium]|nr:hypothetical protein [Phycisphaerae bacterium]
YSSRRTVRAALPSVREEIHLEHIESPEAMGPTVHESPSLHDEWTIVPHGARTSAMPVSTSGTGAS